MLPLSIARALRSDRPDEGFTLVELMVVILIIAILIGAAIPTFLGLRNRAHDSVAQQDLRNTLTAAKVASVDNDGSYAEVTPASLAETEPALEFAALEAGEPITDITDSRVYVAASEAQFAALRRSNSGAYFCAIEGRDRGAEMGRIDDPEGLTQGSLTPEDCSGLPTEDEPESPGLGDLNLEAVLLPNGDTEVTWDPVPGATEYEVCDDDGCQITTDTHYVGRGTVTVRPRNSGGGYIGGGSSTGGGGGGGSAIPPKPTGQGKPTGTIGISYDGTNVQLTWNGLGDVVDRYEVRRCADPGCTDGLTIATVQPDGENDHTYLDNVTALKAMGKTVARYQVVAFAGNLGAASNWAEVYLAAEEEEDSAFILTDFEMGVVCHAGEPHFLAKWSGAKEDGEFDSVYLYLSTDPNVDIEAGSLGEFPVVLMGMVDVIGVAAPLPSEWDKPGWALVGEAPHDFNEAGEVVGVLDGGLWPDDPVWLYAIHAEYTDYTLEPDGPMNGKWVEVQRIETGQIITPTCS